MPHPSRITLSAGSASVSFDVLTGGLGRLQVRGTEVLRGLYGAVRETDWGTPASQITNLKVTENSARFEASVRLATGDFWWRGEVTLTEESLEFHFEGGGDAQTNRAGLCILFPHQFAGSSCLVTHSDGSLQDGSFPERISPHQPFFDVHVLEMPKGIRVETRGDVFEMEDQRNWTDASFKLYCRPLALPKPYRAAQIDQRVLVHFGKVAGTPTLPPCLKIGSSRWKLPSIGTVGENALGLPLDHLRTRWKSGLHTQTDLKTGENFVVVDPPEAARAGEVPGTDANFTELNRSRPEAGAPGISFASNPQSHAFDDQTIIESMPMLGECVRTAKSFLDGPVHVGPVTMGRSDPRELGPIAAGWFLGGIAALAEAGASSATYLDTETFAASPAAEVLRAIGGRGYCLEAAVSPPDLCAVLAFEDGGLLLANLAPDALEIAGYSLGPWEFRVGRHG